jgi:hypothetical protein
MSGGRKHAIEDGMYQPAMKARMSELEQQKAEIEKRLAATPADMPDVHPNISEHYRAKVIRLAETLAEPESNGEAREGHPLADWRGRDNPAEKRGESRAILRGELMAGYSRSCRGPPEVPQARSYNKRACIPSIWTYQSMAGQMIASTIDLHHGAQRASTAI